MVPADRAPSGPGSGAGSRGPGGGIVAASWAAGLVAAVLLVAAPFVPAQERAVTGAVLCGFAVGWAALAVLSERFGDGPQRWAAVPAVVLGLGGLLLVAFGGSVGEVLDRLWPPVVLVMAIWSVVRVHRRMRSRAARWLLYPVIAVLVLASVGGGVETVAEAVDARAYPAPGPLIDVGGHRLHLHCTGSGGPTVVLEPGAGGMSSTMGWIAPAVARDTRVCVYDRAGRGWSEPAGTPQDADRVATDLHTLLRRGNVPGPYVVAGHSFGGLYVLTFAARYPGEVAGMVLVDSTAPATSPPPAAPGTTPETTPAAPGRPDSSGAVARVSALLSTAGRLGLARLYGWFDVDPLPPRSRDEVRAGVVTASAVRSTIDEYVQAGRSAEEAGSLRTVDGTPLVVLTAGLGHDATWAADQDHLVGLSTHGVHRVVDGATHEALVGDERAASATTRAILDVVTSVRSGQPVPR